MNSINNKNNYFVGLKFPDSPTGHFVKKDTYILTNHPGLQSLGHLCPGNHAHDHTVSGIKTKVGWVTRSSLAGHYPVRLCKAFANSMDAPRLQA